MKKVFALLLAIMVFPSTAQAIEKGEMLGYLKRISFPLFVSEGKEVSCIGYNAKRSSTGSLGLSATAGHCGDHVAPRHQDGSAMRGITGYYRAYTAVHDEQVFHRPDCGYEYASGFSTKLTVGEEYYSLGHRSSSDTFEKLELVRMSFVRNDPDRGLVFSRTCDGDECRVNMLPGVSGSPIVDIKGVVVGTFKGFLASRHEEPLASPADLLVILVPSTARTTVRVNNAQYCPSKDVKESK